MPKMRTLCEDPQNPIDQASNDELVNLHLPDVQEKDHHLFKQDFMVFQRVRQSETSPEPNKTFLPIT